MRVRVKCEKYLTKKKNGLSEISVLMFDSEKEAISWIDAVKKIDNFRTLGNFTMEVAA